MLPNLTIILKKMKTISHTHHKQSPGQAPITGPLQIHTFPPFLPQETSLRTHKALSNQRRQLTWIWDRLQVVLIVFAAIDQQVDETLTDYCTHPPHSQLTRDGSTKDNSLPPIGQSKNTAWVQNCPDATSSISHFCALGFAPNS